MVYGLYDPVIPPGEPVNGQFFPLLT